MATVDDGYDKTGSSAGAHGPTTRAAAVAAAAAAAAAFSGTVGTSAAALYNCDGSISLFSGEDKAYSSTKWAQDIEDNAEVFGWTPQQKLIIARKSLCGTASLWLRSEKVFRSYEDLRDALVKEFPDTINSKEMHELMAARKKNKDESYYQYMLIMKELGKRARFPDYVAIQYIIDGIQNSQVNKMILFGVTTYPVLKEKLAIYEKMKAEKKKETRFTEAAVRKTGEASITRRCYNCGEKSHVSAQCPNGLKCFRCNEYGHIGVNCPWVGQGGSGNGAKTERNIPTMSVKQSTSGPAHRVIGSRSATQSVKQRSAMFGTTETPANPCECSSGHANENVIELSMSNAGPSEVLQIVNKDIQCVKSVGKPVKTVVIAGKNSYSALIDSGSDVNLISAELGAQIFAVKCNVDGGLTLTGLGRSQVKSLGKITTTITIDGQCYDGVTFHVIPRDCMPYDIIIGHEFLKDVCVLMNDGSVNIFRDECAWLKNVNCFTGETESLLEHVKNPAVKQKAAQCIDAYHPVQVKDVPLELKIVLKDDVPISQRPRRLSLMEQGIVEKQIDEWFDNIIIPAGNEDKALRRLTQVLDVASQYGLTIPLPFQLLIGTKIKCKEDIGMIELIQEIANQYDSAREELRQKAKDQILAVQEENRKYFNKKRKENQKYSTGDLEAIKRTQFGTGLKLKPKYLGPYKVTKVNLNDRYDVEKVNCHAEDPNCTSSSADNMKRWPSGQ